jgi:hypothetical protein
MSFKLNVRMALFPFDGANPRLAEDPAKLFNYPQEWRPLFGPAKCLATVHWSADPSLGLPIAPYSVEMSKFPPTLSQFEYEPQPPPGPLPLNQGNGLCIDLTRFADYSVAAVRGDNIFYVRLKAKPGVQDLELYGVDLGKNEIPGTRQKLLSASAGSIPVPLVFFGPGIAALCSTAPVNLESVVIGNLHYPEGPWIPVATVAPDMPRVAAFSLQNYLYDPVTYQSLPSLSADAALIQRLLADSLARQGTPAPANSVLDAKVHRALPRNAADAALKNPWASDIQDNPGDYLRPGQTISVPVDLGNGQTTQVTVEPLHLLQYIAAIGPVEACALGASVTIPTTLPPVLSLSAMGQAFSSQSALPFPLLRIVGTFQAPPSAGPPNPSQLKIVSYARPCWVDLPRTTYSEMGSQLGPTVKDGPAHADVEISFAQSLGPESIYLERTFRSSGVKTLLLGDDGNPKALHPSDYTSVKPPKRISHAFDMQVPLPLAAADVGTYVPTSRDEFGRWRADSSAHCNLEPWPVSPPTLLSAEIEYTQSGDVTLTVLASWNWTFRTPSRIRIGLALGKGEADPALDSLVPSNGVTAPLLGTSNPCSLIFAADGTPSISFNGPSPTSPSPTVDPYESVGSGKSGSSIDERTYRLRFPLGGAATIFATVSRVAVAIIADAQEVVSGTRWSLPSGSLRKSILDPRPPSIPVLPWELRWASRSNPAKRSHITLPLPPATGSLKGFMVWRAHESSLFDVLLPVINPQSQSLLYAIQHEIDMGIRLSTIKGLFENLDASTPGFRTRFISLFEAASTEIYSSHYPEFDISSRQTGLEFFLLTAISGTNVPSDKTDLACIYAVATPQAKSRSRPFVQVITASDTDLFELGSLALLIVSSQDEFEPEEVRVFWGEGHVPSSEEELFLPLKSFPTSLTDAARYISDLKSIIERRPKRNFGLFMCTLPRLWSRQYLTVDICSAARVKPTDDIPSPRAPLVSCFSLPNTRPSLILRQSEVPTRRTWTVLYDHLPFSGGSTDTASEVLLSYVSPNGGPTTLQSATLNKFTQTALQITHSDGNITAAYKPIKNSSGNVPAIEITMNKPLKLKSVSVSIRDPRGYTATLSLPE